MKKDVYELTNPQKSIWYTEQFYNDTTINNICGSSMIYEKVDIDLLKRAINNVVEQNDAFRIHIIFENNIVKQYISDYKNLDIDVISINSLDDIKNVEANEVCYKFDMIDSDLFKFKIILLKNGFAGVILTAHHIISDSWSLGLTIQEIVKNYYALKNNTSYEFSPLSYIDYINSEKEYKLSSKFENDKNYWNEVFQTIPETATIPSLKNSKNSISNNAKRANYTIEKDLLLKINEFCKSNKISVFNFFMAVFSLYIGRVSNIDDFVIGTPILNRGNFKEKHTMGMFINTVPVRVNNLNTATFKQLASTLGRNMMNILRHQKYSYNSILEDLRSKNENVPNLYNIIISYQVTKALDKKLGDYTVNWAFTNYCANDLNIHIYDLNDTGSLMINYDYLIDKYSDTDISDFHLRIIHIISQILSNPDINCKNLEIVTEQEKNMILNSFNDTNVNYPKNKTIVDLFEEQVEKTPNNIAVVFKDKKLTYKELNQKANSLAQFLVSNGIKQNTVIGLRLDKKLEMAIGILAIIKAGCCYLPINMQYPKDRMEFMLKDSNAQLLIGTTDSLSDIDIDIDKLDISLSREEIYTMNSKNLNLKISPEDLIYIIYTSGSTGTPKGAMLCHRNIVRLFKNDKPLFDFGENDTWTMFHSVAFDFSVWEMYGALLFGGKLILVSDDVARDPDLLLNLMREENVTVLNQTPTYFYKLLKAELQKEDDDLNVRYIIFGGEALKPNLIKQWYIKYPDTKLINMYGITETTVHVTFKELEEKDLESHSSNIGVPIPTLHVLILDRNLNLLPFGVEGEMCVIGEGVFKGYLNRADLNEQKLIQKTEYSDRLIYRSGDTAIMHKDGHLEYIGRIDTQVKIRGFRVELGEIEEKIRKYSNIDTCIVTKKTDENNREILCAYYIKNGPLNISALRILLKTHLPSYMIPQYFIEISKVPININGKTDFKALPLPQNAQTDTEMLSARNDIDKKLIDIYESTLHVSNISLNDSFFDLGGDSLTAINVCELINQTLSIDLKVKDILEKDIILDLSDYISNISLGKNTTKEILPAKECQYYPLSSAQKRIYYTSKMIGDNNLVYNVPGAVLINKILDKDKVRNCFNKIIEKQPSFRTSFVLQDDGVKQTIAKDISLNIKIFKNENSEIDDLINNFSKPFDLEIAPLLRIELHYIDNEKTLILMDSHHIIMDGTSLQIFLEDFCKLYNGDSIDNLSIDYKDFAIWENNFINSEDIKTSENYWINKFKDMEIPSLNLPYDYTPTSKSYIGTTISKKIPKKSFDNYIEFSKKLGVSPYMFFISAFFILLYKYTGQEDILLGSSTSGRDNYQLKNIIGMFVNNLVVHAKINSNNTFAEFLNTIKAEIMEDLSYQDYPYNLLVKKLNLPIDNSQNPLFDVLFTYQNANSNKLYLEDNCAEIIKSNPGISKFNLSIEINPDVRTLNLEYRTDIFKEKTINTLFKHYINTLDCILDNSDIQIKNVSILSDNEKNKILYNFNDTYSDYDKNKHIHTLFEEQVKLTPNNVAIVFEEKSFTYKELNEKANQLAHYLANNKIGQGDIVGIMLPRSLELIVAIFAVLKVGACYIPIDPTYPKNRITYMLENSNAKLLLTFDAVSDNVDFENKLFVDLENISQYYTSNTNNLKTKIFPDSPSYIIYTSGSTGLPKGVVVSHKSLTNLCDHLNKNVDFLSPDSKYKNIASVTTASFDIFIFETLICLQAGLKIVLANEDEQRVPSLLDKLIQTHNIQIIQMTPSRMQFFVDNHSDMPNISNLKNVVLAGEALPLDLKNTLLDLGIEKVYNGYGPSETTIFETFTDVTNQSFITIGTPINNTQLYILDKDLNPVPTGIAGELYISGDSVGIGYLNNDDLTSKRFIKNPFVDSLRMYKSGDLCKYTDSGELIYLGRLDNQVKVRGLRIELGEIESEILKYPFIKKVKVVKQNIGNREFISAYYISSRRIRIADLRKHLSDSLPKYMVPSYFTALDDFPYTPNGKIDKKALPVPTGILTNTHKYKAPKTPLQTKLVSIWEQLLNSRPIGVNDNFFELGGDSILAMNLNIQLLQITDKISYSDIFDYPTILELENKINSIFETSNNNATLENINKYTDILSQSTQLPEALYYESPKNILLTGVTGFLGIHILDNFLRNEAGKVYAIIRKDPGISPTEKLLNKLHYYFDSKYDHLINDRIFVIEGEISSEHFGLNQEDLFNLMNSIDVIVNSAAKVSHYGSYQDFYNSNVKSVENIINLAKAFDKKIYHISTLSVSGNSFADQYYTEQEISDSIDFRENNFYIGQSLSNVYIRSKFEAEKLILNSIENGVDSYILRVGNLMPRYSDGKFQENYMENAYINRLNSFLNLGYIPENITNAYLEFTPIDYTADAIVKLLQYSTNKNRIFHIFNHKHVYINKMLSVLDSFGLKMEVLDQDKFKSTLTKLLKTKKSEILENLINDFDKDMNLSYDSNIKIKSDFTIDYLKLCNFSWPTITKKYIKNIINLLKGE